MVKFRIQYNDGYYVFMENSPHGKCPYIVTKASEAPLSILPHAIEKTKELLQYIKENDLTGLNVHIIPGM